jgi:hypothetical protein
VRLLKRFRRDPNRCRIDEEWCGLFIGRRYCATHEIYWDGGGSCPHAGQPLRVGKL